MGASQGSGDKLHEVSNFSAFILRGLGASAPAEGILSLRDSWILLEAKEWLERLQFCDLSKQGLAKLGLNWEKLGW